MKYDIQKLVFLVKSYYKFQSITQIQRAFHREFGTKDTPSCSVIKNIVSNFEKTGSVGQLSRKPKEASEKRMLAINQVKNMVSDFRSGKQPQLLVFQQHSSIIFSMTTYI